MTIGKRLFRVARANLNDLIDKLRNAAGWDEEEEAVRAEGGGGHAEEAPRQRAPRSPAKDPLLEEAERELEEAIRGARNGRATSARVGPRPEVRSTDAEARRWVEERQGRRPTGARRPAGGNAGAGRGPSSSQIARYYATLNLPNGASLERVKDSYRRLMRDYHPDRYVNDPARHRVATEVSQRLSRAYMELRRHLGDH